MITRNSTPAGHLRQAAEIGESLLSQTTIDPLSNQNNDMYNSISGLQPVDESMDYRAESLMVFP